MQQALVAMAGRTCRASETGFNASTYRLVVRACRSQSLARASPRHPRRGPLRGHGRRRADDVAHVAVRDQLGRAFGALSQDHRTVVVLHHLVGLPLGEIAEILDVPYGTVGSRLHHAMKAMRASLDAAERATVRGGQTA